MNKILIVLLALVSLSANYLINIQTKDIETKKQDLKKLEKDISSINSVENFKSKINTLNISFDTKKTAQEKLLDKIIYYQHRFGANIKTEIATKNNLLSSTLILSINNSNDAIYKTLKLLEQDSFLTISSLTISKDQLYITLILKYPFLSNEQNQSNLSQLLTKYYTLNNVNLKNLNFNDIQLKKFKPELMSQYITKQGHNKKQDIIVDFIFLGNEKIVCINSKILKIGDQIEGYKILDIEHDQVLIKNFEEKKWLKILK